MATGIGFETFRAGSVTRRLLKTHVLLGRMADVGLERQLTVSHTC